MEPSQDREARLDAKLINLADAMSPTWQPLMGRAMGPIEKVLGLDLVNNVYRHSAGQPSPQTFIQCALEYLNIGYSIPAGELENIPQTGPLIVVANHPFGAIEGMVLGSILLQRRPDVRIMANHLLSRIPELRDLFILVNPFSTESAARQNMAPMRQSLGHLRNKGVLGIFPSGEVAHLRWTGGVAECPWTTHLARIVRHAGCNVLPIYFDGRNSNLFQLAGLAHPMLRTAMLARELSRMRGGKLNVRIGTPIPFSRLSRIKDDQQLVDHLRSRTIMLGARQTAEAKPRPTVRAQVPVAAPVAPEALEADIQALDAKCLVADGGDMAAYLAQPQQIPNILREIGRLREVTFRLTGEGTGREIDLDGFDDYYHHLFIWHRPSKQVVGAYRLAFSKPVLEKHGIRGLYTSTLFRIRPQLMEKLGPTIELGRSFVRPEFQKSYAPLMLLWNGIGRVVSDNPAYHTLLGPVSISADYQTASRQLMVDFLNCHFTNPDFNRMVKPRNPFRSHLMALLRKPAKNQIPQDTDQLADLIHDLEGDGKGIPVLLRQYLKLGAHVLSFNVDPEFSDVLDGLIVVDLTKTDRRTLDRYMGKDAAETFLAHYHQK